MLDLSQETPATLKLYGIGEPRGGSGEAGLVPWEAAPAVLAGSASGLGTLVLWGGEFGRTPHA